MTEGDLPRGAGGEGGRKEGEEHAVPLMALDASGLVRWMVARVAIDAVNALLPVVEGKVRPAEASQLRLAVAELRLE